MYFGRLHVICIMYFILFFKLLFFSLFVAYVPCVRINDDDDNSNISQKLGLHFSANSIGLVTSMWRN